MGKRHSIILIGCVCVCFNSRHDVPRKAQRYGAHTRRRVSVLVVFGVFCVQMQFCRFDKVDAIANVQ